DIRPRNFGETALVARVDEGDVETERPVSHDAPIDVLADIAEADQADAAANGFADHRESAADRPRAASRRLGRKVRVMMSTPTRLELPQTVRAATTAPCLSCTGTATERRPSSS